MPVPYGVTTYAFDDTITARFVAVVADGTRVYGAKLPGATTDVVIGILQEPVQGSASRTDGGSVQRDGSTWLKMAASSSGSAGAYIKLGNTSGHGTAATLPGDQAYVFARALTDWSSGTSGQEEIIEVELTLAAQTNS